jgi:hypothetical protein
VEELSFARSDGEESPTRDPFDSTELIQKTVGLLSAHKSAIAEMVEVRLSRDWVWLWWCVVQDVAVVCP